MEKNSEAKKNIRKIIDCRPNVWDRREELFKHYKELFQRKVIVLRVLNDLKIKKTVLEQEKARCLKRSKSKLYFKVTVFKQCNTEDVSKD